MANNKYEGFWGSLKYFTIPFFALSFLSSLAQADMTAYDAIFRIPIPPVNTPYDHVGTVKSLIATGLLCVIILAFAIREAFKKNSVLPIAIFFGAEMLIFSEAFCDLLGAVWYPISKEHTLLDILGRQNNWILLTYAILAGFILVAYKVIESSKTSRALWLLYFGGVVFNVILEETLLNSFTPYIYYGNQPLILISKFPLWWGFVNFGALFCLASLLYKYRDALQGWKALYVLPLSPMIFCGFHGFAGLPAYIAINGNYSWLVTQSAGLLTVLMAIVAVRLTTDIVLQRDFRTTDNPPPCNHR